MQPTPTLVVAVAVVVVDASDGVAAAVAGAPSRRIDSSKRELRCPAGLSPYAGIARSVDVSVAAGSPRQELRGQLLREVQESRLPAALPGGSSSPSLHPQHGQRRQQADPGQAGRELAHCLRPMLSRLPDHYREAVTLIDLEGLSQHDAALQAGLSLSGMKSRVQRGRQALEQVMLACCRIETDAGGRVMDYQVHGTGCGSCAGGCGPR